MNTKSIIRKAGLDALEIKAQRPAAQKRTMVFLHGYGANMYDLAPLARYLDPKAEHDWYFPNGPIALPMGPGYDGRAWFNLDVERLMQLRARGLLQELTEEPRPGIDHAAALVLDFLKALNVAPENLVFAGFSQGGMTAMQAWVTAALPLHALVLWSTSLTDRRAWQAAIDARQSQTKVLISHGHQDEVLPFAAGKALADLLLDAKLNVKFIPFDGGHEIPMQVLEQTKDLIHDHTTKGG